MKPPVNDFTPPPPPPPADIKQQVRFTAPVVTDEEVEGNLMTQDELSTKPQEAPSTDIVVEETPHAQAVIEQPKQETEVFLIVEEPPVFPGNIYEFIGKSLKYPEEAKELGIQGKVYVSFVVEKDGSVSNVIVKRGIGGGCDEEAVRVVQSMPNWTLGKQRGHEVRVQFNLPVSFKLLQ